MTNEMHVVHYLVSNKRELVLYRTYGKKGHKRGKYWQFSNSANDVYLLLKTILVCRGCAWTTRVANCEESCTEGSFRIKSQSKIESIIMYVLQNTSEKSCCKYFTFYPCTSSCLIRACSVVI